MSSVTSKARLSVTSVWSEARRSVRTAPALSWYCARERRSSGVPTVLSARCVQSCPLLVVTDRTPQVAYQPGKGSKPVYALEGSSKSPHLSPILIILTSNLTVAVAGSAIQWLRDSLGIIKNAPEIGTLASESEDSGGLYFVPAFGGLLAPYWDPTAAGILIGISSYTNRSHIARATLESCAFQTHAIIDAMRRDSGIALDELRVDGGMTNGDLAMQLVADLGGFDVVRPQMRESTALGAALLAGSSIKLFGWDLSRPETLKDVNEHEITTFKGSLEEEERTRRWEAWKEAVRRSSGWDEGRGQGSKV